MFLQAHYLPNASYSSPWKQSYTFLHKNKSKYFFCKCISNKVTTMTVETYTLKEYPKVSSRFPTQSHRPIKRVPVVDSPSPVPYVHTNTHPPSRKKPGPLAPRSSIMQHQHTLSHCITSIIHTYSFSIESVASLWGSINCLLETDQFQSASLQHFKYQYHSITTFCKICLWLHILYC